MYKSNGLTIQEFEEKYSNKNVKIRWKRKINGEIIDSTGELKIDREISGSNKIAILLLKENNNQERINVKLIESIIVM